MKSPIMNTVKSKTYRIKVVPEKKVKPLPAMKIIEKKYQINECFVAQKPITEVLYDDKYFHASIHYAEYKGEWAWGEDHQYKGSGVGCGGGGSLPSFSPIRKEPRPVLTKEQAREAAIKSIQECFTKRGDHPYGKSCKPVIDACKRALSPQLSLF